MGLEQPVKAEYINKLLSNIESLVNNNNADEAQLVIHTLNDALKSWCESDTPPSALQLKAVQTKINAISEQANVAKNESSKAIIKQKKTGKAISAYKSV